MSVLLLDLLVTNHGHLTCRLMSSIGVGLAGGLYGMYIIRALVVWELCISVSIACNFLTVLVDAHSVCWLTILLDMSR